MHNLSIVPMMHAYSDQAPAAIAGLLELGHVTRDQARTLALLARTCSHLSAYRVGRRMHVRTDGGRHVILTRAGATRYP